MQYRVYCTAVRNTLVVGLLLVKLNSVQGHSAPEVLALEEATKELPPSYHCSVSGLAFFQNKLYAGSGLGLLEISNGLVKKVYRWDKASTSVVFPWHDNANELLWAQVSGLHQLAYYDGKIWRTVNRPKPKQGYISRGDGWEGFRGASNRKNSYFQGGGRAWAWKGSKWIEEENAPTKTNKKSPLNLLDRLIATDDHLYFVMRDEKQPFRTWVELHESLGLDNRFRGNAVYFFANAHWNLVANRTTKFLSEETTAVNNKGYIRTTKGDLLEVTEGGIVKLDTPGICEAITTSSIGTLLASFRRQGVFELKGQWYKLLGNPNPNSEEDWEVCLTAAGEQIALSIVPRPGKSAEMPNDNSRIAIWISEGQEWRPVLFH